MAYTSGTATDYKDLMARLATYVGSHGWAVIEQTSSSLYLCGEGLAALDQIYCGIDAFENTGSGFYNWELAGSFGYRAGRTVSNHPMSSGPNKCFAYLWDTSIPYWFVVNGRRIIVVAKIGTTYQTIHLGLLTVPGTDAQYSYPLLIGGSGNTRAQAYSDSTSLNSAFWGINNTGNSYGNGMLCLPGGKWQAVEHNSGSYDGRIGVASENLGLAPYMLSSIDDIYVIDQIYMADNPTSTSTNIYGAVEGLFRVSGDRNSAENIITVSGINYLVVPDVFRSSIESFCALRLN
jgi:hypothetical protein